MRAVKSLFCLALLASLLLTSCSTLSNRRDLFGPTKPHGAASKKLEKM